MNSIEFYTEDPSVLAHFAPQPAKKAVPDWYRLTGLKTQVPGETGGYNTVKNCMPVQDWITAGYIIFNTYEFKLEPLGREGYEEHLVTVKQRSYLDQHHHRQCPIPLEGRHKHYIKINQPWQIRTPPGYSCLIQQPFYHFQTGWRLLPAIVDTDRHDTPVSLPMYTLGRDTVTVNSGEPLAQIIPFRREDWKMSAAVRPLQQSRLQFVLEQMYRTIFHAKKTWQ
jgi:hypothetical protein